MNSAGRIVPWGFNSATVVTPWKRQAIPVLIDGVKLQFGHGCDAVETLDTMFYVSFIPVLQFGHGCDAVETAVDGHHGVAHLEASIRPRL